MIDIVWYMQESHARCQRYYKSILYRSLYYRQVWTFIEVFKSCELRF
jgi:hypothetical protein